MGEGTALVQPLTNWLRRRRYHLLVGVVVWGLLAVAAAILARERTVPQLEAMVTLDEWATAILVIPQLPIWIFGMGADAPPNSPMGTATQKIIPVSTTTALVVFGLDLVVRAVYGLGWKPFYL